MSGGAAAVAAVGGAGSDGYLFESPRSYSPFSFERHHHSGSGLDNGKPSRNDSFGVSLTSSSPSASAYLGDDLRGNASHDGRSVSRFSSDSVLSSDETLSQQEAEKRIHRRRMRRIATGGAGGGAGTAGAGGSSALNQQHQHRLRQNVLISNTDKQQCTSSLFPPRPMLFSSPSLLPSLSSSSSSSSSTSGVERSSLNRAAAEEFIRGAGLKVSSALWTEVATLGTVTTTAAASSKNNSNNDGNSGSSSGSATTSSSAATAGSTSSSAAAAASAGGGGTDATAAAGNSAAAAGEELLLLDGGVLDDAETNAYVEARIGRLRSEYTARMKAGMKVTRFEDDLLTEIDGSFFFFCR